ncbi:MAG: periplasmic heavy metal sensor [Verrucomicrobiae bacterium]|nr:periplasmic heavy metal sensor [Verrucomicrobiae bacterium]
MQCSTKLPVAAVLIMAVAAGSFHAFVVRAGTAEAAPPKFEATQRLIAEKLDAAAELSSEQREKARTLLVAELPALKKVTDRLAEGQTLLRDLMADPQVEEKTIRAETAKLTDALVEYAKQRAKLIQQLKAILTAEQIGRNPDHIQSMLARFVDDIAKALQKE